MSTEMLYSAQVLESINKIEKEFGEGASIQRRIKSRRAIYSVTSVRRLKKAHRDLHRLYIMLVAAKQAERVMKQLYKLS